MELHKPRNCNKGQNLCTYNSIYIETLGRLALIHHGDVTVLLEFSSRSDKGSAVVIVGGDH